MEQTRILRISSLLAARTLAVIAGVLAVTAIWTIHETVTSDLPILPQQAAISGYDVVALTNDERADRDLPALASDPLLTSAAQRKADDMAEHQYYAHVGPDGKTPTDWLKEVGYKYLNAGENLVIDRTSASQAVSAWMGSAAHRENILRPQFTQIGVGVAEGRYDGQDTIFVVQIFATPAASAPVVRAPKPQAPSPEPEAPKPTPKPVATPIVVQPVQLPSLDLSPKPTGTSTVPPKNDSLTERVTEIVRPATQTIQVESVPTTTATSSSDTLMGTLVTGIGWENPIEFEDMGTTTQTPSNPRGFATLSTRFQERIGVVRVWLSEVSSLWN